MPRKPRIELPGKYHIINRGVAQMRIFKEPADYEYFEELMCFYAKNFGITMHNSRLHLSNPNNTPIHRKSSI